MPDPCYPSIDMDFIKENIIASGKLVPDGIVKVGATTTFILEGSQAIYKRSILVRELAENQVCLEQATSLAWRFSFLGKLISWLENNRNWKEGAYLIGASKN